MTDDRADQGADTAWRPPQRKQPLLNPYLETGRKVGRKVGKKVRAGVIEQVGKRNQ